MKKFTALLFLATLLVTAQASAQIKSDQLTAAATLFRYASGPISTLAGNPSDWVVIGPSTTKNVSVSSMSVCATATVPASLDVLLIMRSTADTSGTSSPVGALNLARNGVAATGSVAVYTVNPTYGTAVGNVDVKKLNVGPPGSAGCLFFGPFATMPALRGPGQQLAINLNGATMPSGLSISFMVETIEQ